MKVTELNMLKGLPVTILIVVSVLVWMLSYSGVAAAGSYTDSAHGKSTYGVNRSDVVPDPDHPDAYDIGSCAHCHDMFNGSIIRNFALPAIGWPATIRASH